ncbi:MAG: PLP-dependent aminotransferase family protein [Solirubrobacterales bacterium]|nr:PLP-dependent aminotransferase family protein [Solirubrobacterales bacterium]
MADSGPISFARGAPSYDIVNVEGLRSATRAAAEGELKWATPYGSAAGFEPLREWIATRHGVDPTRVLVTNGSMQADAFLFAELVSPGTDVVIESPTYDRTLLGLRECGATLHAVDLESDGINIEALRSLIEDGGVRPALAHILPTFHNPAGCTLSLAKRVALLEIAAEYGITVFEDDPYIDIRFTGEPLPRLLDLDKSGSVVYASSFSKTVCPGIRVGYLVAPQELAAAITTRALNTYISPSMLAQAVVYEFCASGEFERSVATVKAALAERVAVLSASLRERLPEAAFVEPEGGYFLWVEFPQAIDSLHLTAAAKERGVIVTPGTEFTVDGGKHAVRIAYSGVGASEIDEGVARLADAYHSLAQ